MISLLSMKKLVRPMLIRDFCLKLFLFWNYVSIISGHHKLVRMDQISELKNIINRQYRKVRNKRRPCFYRQCNNPSIGSHSQTASSSLKSIVEDGHVMERNPSVFPIRDTQGWKKIGINEATKFPGFCQIHDDKLFRQADSISDKNLMPKALTFLSYRTFAMEMRKKEVYSDHLKVLLNYSDKFVDPNVQDAIRGAMEGMLNCLRVTKPFFLEKYQRMILTKEYSQDVHKVYRSDRNLGVSCATTINPLDITEQPMDMPQPLICFNVLPRKKYTLIIFSYPRLLSTLIEHFIKDHESLDDLLFNYCEEVVLNISLYNSLDTLTLDTIEAAQAPWPYWQAVEIPDIFDFRFKQDTLLNEL